MDNKIRYFTKDDYPEICRWFRAWGKPSPLFSYLPANGFIVPGVAVGFLYMTDSSVSYLDCFVANPKSDQKERDEALDWIVMHLTSLAQTSGTKALIFSTKLEVVAQRAEKLGFGCTGQHVSFAKELK